MSTRFLDLILAERERQKSLPGSEYDITNTPNDWITIASRYLTENGRRKGINPSEEEFKESLIKSAAIILAALEHTDDMTSKRLLRK